jgi:Transposase DDE domain group 1
VCCGRATPAPTPLPTTSKRSTPHSRRFPTLTGTGFRSWSAPTAPAEPRTSPTTSAVLRERGITAEFSVGFTMTDTVQQAILELPEYAWTPAVEANGEPRDGADVAELTGLLPDLTTARWPEGMRVIVRRERAHPGAQLSFTDIDGRRFQALATDTAIGQLAHLEARHRAHARVEDRIRNAKDTGLGRFPSRQVNVNAAWLELTLLACDLIAWTQTILLHGDLARCEPKALRYRLLHVAARITRGQRRRWLRIAAH